MKAGYVKLEITGSAAGRGSSRSPSCQICSTQLFATYHPGEENDEGDASTNKGSSNSLKSTFSYNQIYLRNARFIFHILILATKKLLVFSPANATTPPMKVTHASLKSSHED